jgi:iron complex outermembrane receptor protein
MRNLMLAVSVVALGASGALAGTAAQAQTAGSAASDTSGAGFEIPELIVTAQRRSENIQETPVAVSAFGAQELERKQVTRVENLAASVPSLYIQQVTASPSAVAIALRGSQDLTGGLITSESPVALYIDDIYQSRLQVANFGLADIERIEVLRGPQGTLYGRNSMTGAIKFVTRQPDGSTWLSAEGALGSYGKQMAKISLGAPISPHLAGALSAVYSDQGGWQRNRVTGKHVGDMETWGVHGALGLVDVGPWDVKASLTYTRTSSDGQHFTPVDSNAKPILGAFGSTQSPLPGRGDNDQFASSLNASYKFDNFTLKSITAYQHLNDHWALDFSGGAYAFDPTTAVAGFYRRSDAHDDQFTQEFQAYGDVGKFHWLGGLFFFDEHATQTLRDTFGPNIFGPTALDVLPTEMSVASKSYAAYGQVDYSPTDELTVSAGLRYGRDEKTFNGTIQNGFASFPATLAPAHDKLSTNVATPKFTVQYKFTPDLMTYATVARGYRSGSFNGLVIADPALFGTPYQPEYNWSFEVGAKSEFLDRRVKLNVAAYTQKISNLQESVLYNGSNITLNAAKATISGVETELVLNPIRNLNFFANATYTEAKYDELDPTTTAYQSGATQLPLISKWQYQVGGSYRIDPEFLRGWGVLLAADYGGRSSHYSEATNASIGYIGTLARANASVSFLSPDDRWTVAFEGRNVTNAKEYFSCLAFIPGLINYCQAAEPAMWQARVRYHF